MPELTWDTVGERLYETGVDHGVLYLPDDTGDYNDGVAWNGLTTVTESPAGADATPQFADNIQYLNLVSAETFGATIEAFTYPEEFGQCDGTASPTPGVLLGQQARKVFGLSYRTKIGNDIEGADFGYKIHLVYSAQAAPSEKAYSTVNDSPSALTFSWAITTTAVPVTGFKPTAFMTIDSTKVDADGLAALLVVLYGTGGVNPRLPSPDEVIAFFSGTVTITARPTVPGFNSGTHTITIPTETGVEYLVGGEVVAAGALVIAADTLVTAQALPGYVFPAGSDNDWFYSFA